MFRAIIDKLQRRVAGASADNLEIVTHASSAFVLKIGAAVASFVLSLVLAHLLGAAGAGMYFLSASIVSLGSTIGRLGLDNVVVRLIAGRGDDHAGFDACAVLRVARRQVCAVSLLVSVLVYAAAPTIAIDVFSKADLAAPLRVASLAILPMSLAFLYAQGLRGLKRISQSMALLSLWVPLFTLSAAVMLAASFGVEGAAWSLVIATVFASLIGAVQWQRHSKSVSGWQEAAPSSRQMLDSSMPLLLAALFNGSHRWLPILLLGYWVSASDVGIFAVAQRLAFITASVLLAVNSIAAPKFAEFYERGDLKGLEKSSRYSASLMMILALPFALPFIVVPEWVMSLYGTEFRVGWAVLLLLALGQYVNVVTGSVNYLLMMTGNERTVRNIAFAAALAKLLLCVWAIPRYGPAGAAAAVAVSMSAQNILAAVVVRRLLGILTIPSLGIFNQARTGSHK